MLYKPATITKAFTLKGIDFGKNDAKFDQIDRYFLDTGVVDQIYKGDKCIVIGRKGTGKTAIAYYIKKQSERDYSRFAEILSFKEVPVALMEQFTDKQHKLSNKFIILWKYIFLVELAKLVMQDESIQGPDKERLNTFLNISCPILKRSPREYLKATIENSFKVNFDVISADRKTTYEEGVVNLLSFLESMEDIIIRVAQLANTYVILADELDDIYEDKEDYYNIIIAMFKAGMDLNAKFQQAYKRIRIVMFLRTDIYANLTYSDKNKWSDMTKYLDWIPRPEETALQTDLFRLINLRIGASLVDSPRGDEDYWNEVFHNHHIRTGIGPFPYVLSRSYYRPRDIIQFAKEAQQKAIENKENKISANSILRAEFGYSRWFLAEVVDELKPKLPFITNIFEALKHHGQYIFTAKDVNQQLQRHKVTTALPVNSVLHILFDFSVIGMFPGETSTKPIFKFRDPNVDFQVKRRFSLHYGLRPALEMVKRKY